MPRAQTLRGCGLRAAMALLVVLMAPAVVPAQETYDLLIRGGRLLDGTGNPWVLADVAVRADRIVAVGRLEGATARRVIEAEGRYVAPGFIDDHSHAAPGLETDALSEGRPQLAQGITTILANPDGGGPVDLSAQRRRLEEHGLGVNVALMVPHGSIRREVMGVVDRAPTGDELERMKELVRAGMQVGAFGMTTGLYSAPGTFAELDEVVEMARVAARFGGVYTSHIRDESDYTVGLVAAVDEVIAVAERAGMPGVVTHVKALGPPVWGYAQAVVERIERARARGVELFADQYPYTASATSLASALVPRWAQEGGHDSLVARIRDAETRERLRSEMAENLERRAGAGRIQFRRFEPDPAIEGRTLAEVARDEGRHPLDQALELLGRGDPGIVSFNMDPEDVRRLMRQPWVMTCTDGDLVPMGEGVPHPRTYGAFPRKLRLYVAEERVLGLEHAIRSMTGLPATVFRMEDRGVVREGGVADLVVFDLGRVRDVATFDEPHRLSEGMDYVVVNGVVAIDEGAFTGVRSGAVLTRRPAPPAAR